MEGAGGRQRARKASSGLDERVAELQDGTRGYACGRCRE